MNYSVEKLRNFTKSVFEKIGFTAEKAKMATDVLISADLRGIDSHGVARLAGYVKQWEIKRLNPHAFSKIIHETPTTTTLDGDRGLGLIVAQEAMEIAIEKAKTYGTGWVAVQNSGHYGIAGYHAMKALKEDMIGMSMTHAASLAAPTYSLEKLLGTNPIAVAIPAGQHPPFVADFATTTVAYGKMQILQRKKQEAPLGWTQDEKGNPSTNPHAPKEGGALLPLGSDETHSSHKGYCLGAMVDIFSGVLSGANFGPWVPPFATAGKTSERTPPVGNGTGHFFGAWRVDAFRPVEDFKKDMDIWIETFKNAQVIEGKEILIPGEPERMAQEVRSKEGIPVIEAVVNDLKNLGEKLGLGF